MTNSQRKLKRQWKVPISSCELLLQHLVGCVCVQPKLCTHNSVVVGEVDNDEEQDDPMTELPAQRLNTDLEAMLAPLPMHPTTVLPKGTPLPSVPNNKLQMPGGATYTQFQHEPPAEPEPEPEPPAPAPPNSLDAILRECGLEKQMPCFTKHFENLDGLLEALKMDGSFEEMGKFLRSDEVGLNYRETSRLRNALGRQGHAV